MGIVKMGAYAGAVMAVLVMGQTIVPIAAFVAAGDYDYDGAIIKLNVGDV